MEVFREAWTYLGDNYFNPKMNGLDWSAERAKYEPYVAGSATPDEMRRVISLMIGDLNSSHSGINPGGAGGPHFSTGRLGMMFDPAEYDRTSHLRISEITPLGPAALAKDCLLYTSKSFITFQTEAVRKIFGLGRYRALRAR